MPTQSKSTDEGATVWGVGAAGGRGTGGCEEVGTGADAQCSQRGAFSLEGGELFRVYLCFCLLQCAVYM